MFVVYHRAVKICQGRIGGIREDRAKGTVTALDNASVTGFAKESVAARNALNVFAPIDAPVVPQDAVKGVCRAGNAAASVPCSRKGFPLTRGA